MLLPWPALALVAGSVLCVSIGGPVVQSRFPRAPLMALVAMATTFALAVAFAMVGGPRLRALAEPAVGGIVAWGLPATASLVALVVFHGCGPRLRVGLALAAGATGTLYALLAALVVACGLLRDCL